METVFDPDVRANLSLSELEEEFDHTLPSRNDPAFYMSLAYIENMANDSNPF